MKLNTTKRTLLSFVLSLFLLVSAFSIVPATALAATAPAAPSQIKLAPSTSYYTYYMVKWSVVQEADGYLLTFQKTDGTFQTETNVKGSYNNAWDFTYDLMNAKAPTGEYTVSVASYVGEVGADTYAKSTQTTSAPFTWDYFMLNDTETTRKDAETVQFSFYTSTAGTLYYILSDEDVYSLTNYEWETEEYLEPDGTNVTWQTAPCVIGDNVVEIKNSSNKIQEIFYYVKGADGANTQLDYTIFSPHYITTTLDGYTLTVKTSTPTSLVTYRLLTSMGEQEIMLTPVGEPEYVDSADVEDDYSFIVTLGYTTWTVEFPAEENSYLIMADFFLGNENYSNSTKVIATQAPVEPDIPDEPEQPDEPQQPENPNEQNPPPAQPSVPADDGCNEVLWWILLAVYLVTVGVIVILWIKKKPKNDNQKEE